ncbi:hypothetical protein FRC17_004592 [Serendipita sp. 399]|nr:hypothetical protein FRC17_004592 [Serendipita sp. 399]
MYFELFREILGESSRSGKLDDDEDENTIEDNGAPRDGKGREERRKIKEREKMRLKGKERAPQKPVDGVVDGPGLATGPESKLTSAILTGINRALPFAGTDNAKLDQHMDTLFRITHEASFNVSIQALVLIQRVSETKTSIQSRYFRTLYASLQDHRLATSSKQAMYLNLLFKSLKMDKDTSRVKAFVKRFLQALASGPGYEPSFICGGLFLLGELFTVTPGLRKAVSSPPDAPDSYDPKKREPEYSGAATSCIWELTPLLYHYHPSVSLHARQLLDGSPLTANADLTLNTLSHFLDLFVYKNPKKPKPRGPSAMQPAAALGNDGNSVVRFIKGMTDEGLGSKGTVNEEDFWRKKVQDIPANQLFFHKFFNQRQQRNQDIREKTSKRKGRKDLDEDVGDEGASTPGEASDNDSQEEEIWQAMKRSIPSKEAEDVDTEESDELQGPVGSDPEEASENEEEEQEESDEDSGSEEASDNDEPFDLAMDDESDIVGSDADAPEGLLTFGSDGSEGEGDWQGVESTVLGKRKKGGKQAVEGDDGRKRKKRRLKDLPLFASMEDYEALIDAQPEDNI